MNCSPFVIIQKNCINSKSKFYSRQSWMAKLCSQCNTLDAHELCESVTGS